MRRRTIGDEGATAFGARRLPLGRRTDDLGMQAKSDERAYFVAVLGGEPLLKLLAVETDLAPAPSCKRRHRLRIVRTHQEDMRSDRGVGSRTPRQRTITYI
jgi:hypothetical protein